MTDDVLYDDGRVMLDGRGVTPRRYYFPFGASEHIPGYRLSDGRSFARSNPLKRGRR